MVKTPASLIQRVLRQPLFFSLALLIFAISVLPLKSPGTNQETDRLFQENQTLLAEIERINLRNEQLSASLDTLISRDDELYRVVLGSKPVSSDLRQVGVGGEITTILASYPDRPSQALISYAETQMDQIERRLRLQSKSLEELERLAHRRRDALAETPAILPIEARLTSGFGMRRHPILRVYRMHRGVDFPARTGTPVYATANGEVEFADRHRQYGIMIRIEHKRAERTTLYAHLSRVAPGIRPGVRVTRGQVIGYSGNTGASTGPHLHYEIRDLNGNSLNPVPSFAAGVTPSQYLDLVQTSLADIDAFH